jgi:predicted nucleic acid-binding protein
MVLVDTSVWIGLYRAQESATGKAMRGLISRNEVAICGPVFVEYVGGFKSSTLRRMQIDLMRSLHWLDTTRTILERAAEWLGRSKHVGAVDAIVASTAFEFDIPLLTFDKDFEELKRFGVELLPSDVFGHG